MSLTTSDLKQINTLINQNNKLIDKKMITRIDAAKNEIIDELDHRSNQRDLALKDYFFNLVDPILKEVQASREERTIMSFRLSNHEDRIQKVEHKLKISHV